MRRICILHLLLLMFCLTLSGLAQSTNATISGQITDPSGRVVPDADIQILNEATGEQYVNKTNNSGIYNISILPPGQYRVQVSKIGFKTLIKPDVVLNVQSAVALNFSLQLGAASESITIEAGSTLLNTTDASVSTVVDRKFVENMPLNGRSLQSLISLAPGVVQVPIQYGSSAGSSGEFSVNGQRAEGNYYSVDGMSANVGVGASSTYSAGASGSLPNQSALGTTQGMTSIDALQEFRISTSTYSAEYGRTPGGQISLQTRSGTNSFHGTAFDYFRNDALDANNWFNDHTIPQTQKTAERQNDFGGTLGGPIWIPRLYSGASRTFFFYSYEGLRLKVPAAAITTQVPDAALRQATPSVLQAFINAFPVPNGGPVSGASGLAYFTGAYSVPSGLDVQSIRIDHTLGKNTHIFGRYSNSSSNSESRSQYNLAQVSDTEFISRGVTSGITLPFGSHVVNDFRFNYTWTSTGFDTYVDTYGGSVGADLSTFLSSFPKYSQVALLLNWGSIPRVNPTVYGIGQTQSNIVDKAQFQIGRHAVTAGVDYRRIELNNGANQYGVAAIYGNASQVQSNSAGSGYTLTSGTTPAAPLFHNVSLYVQDEWKVSPHTSLSLGLRWDLNPPPTNASGRIPPTLDQISNLATAKLLPEGTSLWNTDYEGIAPRVGVSTQLHSERGRETVLRAGWGMFYDTGNTLAAMGFPLLGRGSRKTYTGISFPLSPEFYVLPSPSTSTPYTNSIMAFDRELRLPYAYQWNVSLEQALGVSRSFTLGYVASSGQRLLQAKYINPASVNAAFSNGYGLYTVENGSWSNYQSLQAQFQQRLSSGLQVLLSMTWSHSIDNLSTGYINYQPLLKGDSDFDVRSNFQAAVTYNIPALRFDSPISSLTRSWAIDLRAFSRTAAPVDVYGTSYIAADGTQQYARPNIVSGAPFYVYGSGASIPGGRKINFDAFQSVPGTLGNAPRNFLRGFGENEIDLAIRREFPIVDRIKMQLRAEAFNVFNHPNFGAIYNTMNYGASQFGQAYNTLNVNLKNQNSLYAQGGPRSLQLALKILF